MIYLSRLILNQRSRAVRRDLADCQQLHRTILTAFPQAPTGTNGVREHFGVLYRVESLASAGSPLALLVQSRAIPDWSRLDSTYLAEPNDDYLNSVCRRIDDIYQSIGAGSILIFRLRANPTRRLSTPVGPDGQRAPGKRVELHEEERQVEWLGRKGRQHGFELLTVKTNPAVPDVRASRGDKLIGRQLEYPSGRENANRLTFGSVLFEGMLRVADPQAFRDALEHGIGSGKAYGFGLLSLARPKG